MSFEDNPFLAGIPQNLIDTVELTETQREHIKAEINAPWMFYSRWRALPTGPNGEWEVVDEMGTIAMQPNSFTDHHGAQQRADKLNDEERLALTRRLDKEDR